MRKMLIAGNWKMNLTYQDVDKLVDDMLAQLSDATLARADVLLCPPSIYIPRVLERVKNGDIFVGAQDCSDQEGGAYTGQISAEMLADNGCSYVIVGHSERRIYNYEENALIAAKAQQALAHDLTPIICVGETAEQRGAGVAQNIVANQLDESLPEGNFEGKDIVIAYEPVWAIGTGKVATPDDVREMHRFIYTHLQDRLTNPEDLRILYGGSMKPENAEGLLALSHVDGGLIGGASLSAESFLSIASCA